LCKRILKQDNLNGTRWRGLATRDSGIAGGRKYPVYLIVVAWDSADDLHAAFSGLWPGDCDCSYRLFGVARELGSGVLVLAFFAIFFAAAQIGLALP
jgi:hypothetical protein